MDFELPATYGDFLVNSGNFTFLFLIVLGFIQFTVAFYCKLFSPGKNALF